MRSKKQNVFINGIEYSYYQRDGEPFVKRPIWIYKITVAFQWCLWKVGIAWHNTYADECTPDFDCCSKVKLKKVR